MTLPPVGSPEHLGALESLWAEAEAPSAPQDAPTRSRTRGARIALAAISIVIAMAQATPGAGAGLQAVVALGAAGPTTLGAAAGLAATPPVVDEPAPELHDVQHTLALDTFTTEAAEEAPEPEPDVEVEQAAAPAGPVLPTGKGMWIWKPELTEGGAAAGIVARAQATGLTHIYVRTGSSVQGFHGAAFLDQVLPAAHAAGIAVYGWDFPYFHDVPVDVGRAVAAIMYQTPDGHSIDGFVPDIETPSEGTHLTPENVVAYNHGLRGAVGPDYPLLVAVPRPSEIMTGGRYPYDLVVDVYDAIIPMVYWLNRQPDSDVAGALQWLGRYGKPILPVGQAYDGAPEGGRPGPPPADEIRRFLAAAAEHGATGVSFWSWQHATDEIWSAYSTAAEFAPGQRKGKKG